MSENQKNPQEPDSAIRESFKSFLAEKGLRVTNQRMAIVDAALLQGGHFTAEDLLDAARAIDSSVSRATIYRSLPILTESNLIREVDVGRDYKYYTTTQANTTFQAQVICMDCDKIFEIDAPFMEWYGKTVSDKLNLEVESQRLQVTTRCNVMRKEGACSRAEPVTRGLAKQTS